MLRRFLIAVQYLTRLPVPRSLIPSEGEVGQAAACFPLVGVVVGAGAGLLYTGLSPHLPASLCVLAVLLYAAAITNALHEDGLADALDGFGGGWTREEVLAIMRDSRIGTYGALGLIFLILAKYNLLSLLEGREVWRWLIVAHAASRWTALPLGMGLPYARAQGQGGLVAGRIGWPALGVATLTLGAVLLLLPWKAALWALGVVAGVTVLSGWYYRRRLNGLTGDCLGATNQLAEVAVYGVAAMG